MSKISFRTWFLHCSLLMIPLLAQGATTIGGPVSGTWTAAESPYIVDSTIVVLANDTLTIEPQVVVFFDNSDTLIVYGTLLARGTAVDSILFLDYEKPSWKGVWFIGMNACNSVLEYVHIERPLYGIRSENCQPTIRFSTIRAKSVGVYANTSDLILFECDVQAEGIEVDAIRIEDSDVTIRNCSITAINTNPTRLAVGIRGRLSIPEVTNSIITVQGEGISFGYWLDHVNKGYFSYNLVYVLSQSQAHGIFLDDCNYPSFVNNTIVVKSSHFADKCVYIWENSNPTIENCILYGDSSSQGIVAPLVGSMPILGHSDIYNHVDNFINCAPCTTCISLDPLFVNAESGDFNLTSHSPCIDTGNPLSPPDLDGTRADMGCFPYYQVTGVEPQATQSPSAYNLIEAFPNPFNPATSIHLALPSEQYGSLAVYNQAGRLITMLKSGEFKPGEYKYTWAAGPLGSGVYYVVLKTEQLTQALRLIRIK